jgi:hypothetical protein
MFVVHGYHDGRAYGAAIEPGARSVVAAAPSYISALLHDLQGTEVRATPTSEAVVVALDDHVSVVEALRQHTDVVDITGAVPDEIAAAPQGVS